MKDEEERIKAILEMLPKWHPFYPHKKGDKIKMKTFFTLVVAIFFALLVRWLLYDVRVHPVHILYGMAAMLGCIIVDINWREE